MAVILKRGKTYQVTYEVLTSDNRVKTIKENFTNYQDALEKKELIDGEMDTRFTPDSLFTDVIKDWLSDSYFMSHITKHRESYKNFELYLQDILKTTKVCDINSTFAENILNQISTIKSPKGSNTLSIKTIRCCKLLLSETCHHAMELGIMDDDPFALIHLPDPRSHKKKKKFGVWDYEIFQMILEACEEEKLYVMMQVIFATGITVAHAQALCWNDVYTEKGRCYIRVNKIIQRLYRTSISLIPDQKMIDEYTQDDKKDTKTVLAHYYLDEEQTYMIPIALYRLICEWKELSKDYYHFDVNDHSLMFTTYGIAPYDDRLIFKHLDKITKSIGLPRYTLSGLKYFSTQINFKGRSYREIYYKENPNLHLIQKDLTLQEKAVKASEDFNKKMKEELPNKEKEDAKDLIQQLSQNKNLRKKMLMKLLEIESNT